MKKLIYLVIVAIVFSSCISARGVYSPYGKIDRNCPTFNQNAYFYKIGTGNDFNFKNVMRTAKMKH
jgi:hypothetical protein